MSKKARSWFAIKNEATAAAAELSIFDEIGSWGLTARHFAEQLNAIPKDRPIKCRVNCPGGSVWDALAIYNLLNSRRDKVTMEVTGIAASSGSIIALAGSKTVMPRNTFMMVHNPAGTVFNGESEEMRKYAELLDKVRDQLAGIYASESDMDEEEAKELMDAVSWLSAEECLEKGLCDEITDSIAITAKFDLRRYSNVPKDLAGAGGQPANPPQDKPKEVSMQKIIAALVAAGIAVPDNATEDQVVAKFNELFGAVKNERDQLKADCQKHTDALKKRVEARVKAAIDAKKIKADREASLTALGLADESNLDFLDDIPAPTAAANPPPRPQRGAPPAPAAAGGETDDQKMDRLRNELKEERAKGDKADAKRCGVIARELRDLRGHKDLFAPAAN